MCVCVRDCVCVCVCEVHVDVCVCMHIVACAQGMTPDRSQDTIWLCPLLIAYISELALAGYGSDTNQNPSTLPRYSIPLSLPFNILNRVPGGKLPKNHPKAAECGKVHTGALAIQCFEQKGFRSFMLSWSKLEYTCPNLPRSALLSAQNCVGKIVSSSCRANPARLLSGWARS